MTSFSTTSLRPLPVKDDVDTSVPLLVQRIIQERGHFKNVTEQTLLDESAAEEQDDDSEKDFDEVLNKPQTLEARRSELAIARADIVGQLGRAQNDIGMALDFVSLLLTRDRPDRANLTLSPFMKDLLKDNMGSLTFDSFDAAPSSEADVQADTKVALGWNMKHLEDSANALLASATSLEEEMKKEAQYWDDVLSIREKGWSLCRIGKGSTIGVRYGFTEAAPQFNAQGLAALRPSDDGSVKLDQGLRRIPKSLHVQVKEGNRIISRSRIRPCVSEQDPTEAVIRQARDSLFEEELYHELCREARSILPCGVVVEDGTIVAPMDRLKTTVNAGGETNGRQIRISLVPRDNDTLDSTDRNTTAETIAISLRILMMSVYGQRFRKRSHPPPPLSKDKPQPPIFNLLRVVLSHTFHQAACATVQSSLRPAFEALRSAGMAPVLTITNNTFGLAAFPTSKRVEAKHIERFVASLCEPLSTTMTLTFRRQRASVDVATHLASPYYGTQFRVTRSSSLGASQSPPAVFDQPEPLGEYVVSLVGHLVAVSTVQTLPGWQLQEGTATLVMANAQPAKRRKTVHVAIDEGALALLGTPSDSGQIKVWGVWDGQAASDRADWDKILQEATQV